MEIPPDLGPPLQHDLSAIGVEGLTRHIVSGRAGQECGHRSNVLSGVSQASQRGLRLVIFRVVRMLSEIFDRLRAQGGRTYHVDPDTVATPFPRGGAREGANGFLGRGVNTKPRATHDPLARSEVDDRAS